MGIHEQAAYRSILGVRFFAGDARQAVELGSRGGLVVVPAAPALVELSRDADYRRALLEADLAITDSGLMVLLWNLITRDNLRRVSGLEYLEVLLDRADFREAGASLWVMPSPTSMERNLAWLQTRGCSARPEDCFIAPKYPPGPVFDASLVELIDQRQPRHVVLGLGGGTQEKLGLHLKQTCAHKPAIHCIGAAIGFLSGDQVRIPRWADRWILGWLFRCVSDPQKFIPRYTRALWLVPILLRYRSRLPAFRAA